MVPFFLNVIKVNALIASQHAASPAKDKEKHQVF